MAPLCHSSLIFTRGGGLEAIAGSAFWVEFGQGVGAEGVDKGFVVQPTGGIKGFGNSENKRDIEVVVKDFISNVERVIDNCSKDFGLKGVDSV